MKTYDEWKTNENVGIGAVNLELENVFRAINQIDDPQLKQAALDACEQFKQKLAELMQ